MRSWKLERVTFRLGSYSFKLPRSRRANYFLAAYLRFLTNHLWQRSAVSGCVEAERFLGSGAALQI